MVALPPEPVRHVEFFDTFEQFMSPLASRPLQAKTTPCAPARSRPRLSLLKMAGLTVLGLGFSLVASANASAQERVRLPDSFLDAPIDISNREFNPFDPFSRQEDILQAQFTEEEVRNQPLFDVRIEGNVTIPSSAILQRVETRSGRPPAQRTILEDCARLNATHWFFDVKPIYRSTDDGPVLIFKVVERPILRSVTFIGNKKIKTPELEAHTGLRKDHGFDPAANREAVSRIETLYRDKGYFFARATLEKGGEANDRDVVIRIEEGKKVKVWDIGFEGNDFVSDAILKTKLSTKTVFAWFIGGEYEPDVVRNDVFALKQYYMGLGFFDVQVEVDEEINETNGHVAVSFKVSEGRRYKVGNVEIVGNDVLQYSQLLDEQKLSEGDFFNSRFMRKDVEGMKEQYDELGRLFAKVEPVPHFREDDSGFVDLTYRIDEDTPRYIGQINVHIRGDHPHTQERVVRHQMTRYAKPGQLASGKSLRLAQARIQNSPIWERTDPIGFDIVPVEGTDYMPKLVNRGQSLDRETLQETGQTRLVDTVGAWQPDWLLPTGELPEDDAAPLPTFGHSLGGPREDHSAAKVDDQGRPTNLNSSGRSSLPATDRRLNSIQAPATSLPVGEFGHSLGPTRRRLETAGTAQLADNEVTPYRRITGHGDEYGVRSNRPYYNIDPAVIFRAQSPAPTQDYRGQSIDQFGNPVPQNYLQGMSPQGDPFGDALTGLTAPGFVDINVDVTEGRTGRLQFGVGVNSNQGVVGSISLQEDNFDILRPPRSWSDLINGQAWRGAGQTFRLEAVPGNQVSRYLASWQDPFFMGTDISLSLSGFYYNRYFQEWTEDRIGGRIGLGYILDQYWSVGTSLRLESVDMHGFLNPSPQVIRDTSGDNFLSTVGANITYDTRDSSFMPTTGHMVQFDFEQAFGEFNYPHLELTGGQYFTLWERPDGFGKHVLQFRGQVAWTGEDTPVFEKFYAGGYSSFRGFDFRGVSPRELGQRVGGNFMAVGTAEYLIPITASDNIRGVVFTDFGTVEEDVSFDQFRVTAGFGLRLTIPAMGPAPLAFDFAWPLMQDDSDNTRVFSFYIGFTR